MATVIGTIYNNTTNERRRRYLEWWEATQNKIALECGCRSMLLTRAGWLDDAQDWPPLNWKRNWIIPKSSNNDDDKVERRRLWRKRKHDNATAGSDNVISELSAEIRRSLPAATNQHRGSGWIEPGMTRGAIKWGRIVWAKAVYTPPLPLNKHQRCLNADWV